MSERMYSERGGTSLSNRSLLTDACADTIQDSKERQALLEYQALFLELQNLEIEHGKNRIQLDKVRGLLKDTPSESDGNILLTESGLEETMKRISLQKIDIDRKLLSLEQTPVLQRVIARERMLLMQRFVQKEKEAYEEYQREKEAEVQLIVERYERQRQEQLKQKQESASFEKSTHCSNTIESCPKQKSISWKKFALVCSIIICIVLYTSFLLTTFSEEVDTYICYTTDTGECYHAAYCQYLSRSQHKTTVYQATRSYRSCSRCNPCMEKYQTTIVVRNYFLPALISVPTSVMVYVLLTKKTNE